MLGVKLICEKRPVAAVVSLMDAGALKERCKGVIHASPHLEHYGFALYAGAEVFGMHDLVWAVAVWLFVTGIAVEIEHHFTKGGSEQ